MAGGARDTKDAQQAGLVFWEVLLAIRPLPGEAFPPPAPQRSLSPAAGGGYGLAAGAGKAPLVPAGLGAEAAKLPSSACPGQISCARRGSRR